MTERINVGCGQALRAGYWNIDLVRYDDVEYSNHYFTVCDIRDGFPVHDGSICEVRADQFIEHLTLPELVGFVRECQRVLVAGGEIRLTFPDVEHIAEWCGQGKCDHVADMMGRGGDEGMPKGLLVLNLSANEWWDHRTILTGDLVAQLLVRHGFAVDWIARNGENSLVIGRRG